MRIQQVLQHPDSDTHDLVDVISTDQATCAMVLKQANSPAFNGGLRNIASIHEAVTRLGMREVSEIAMVISLIHGFPLPTTANKVNLFWTHAFLVGSIANEIGKRISSLRSDSRQMLFTAGLLHDIGRAVIGLRLDPDYFAKPVGEIEDDDSTVRLELESYGIDHAEAGAILMELWGFPLPLIETIAHYHLPIQQCDIPAAIVHLASDIGNARGKRIASIDKAREALRDEEIFASLDDEISVMLEQCHKS